jgi:hypothetical protein
MKTKPGNKRLNKSLTALCAAVISLGLVTGSVLAVEVSQEDYEKLQTLKKKEAEKQLPPHQRPAPHNPAAPSVSKAHNLAGAATNPIANLMQIQLQDTVGFKNYNSSSYSNVTTLQAVIPFKLPWEAAPLLITRTTLPYVTTPRLDDPIDSKVSGFGDAEALLLVTPKLKTKGVDVGLGVNTVWPTAGSNKITGNGKYQLGPAALYLNMRTPSWQWGLFGHQLWSVGSGRGGSDRGGVSKLSLQPIITKHFKEGWYLQSPDTPQAYDFKANKWTWALGAVGGRVQKFGKQPVKWFGEILYNPEGDNGPKAKWTAKVNLTFLFPK